MTPQLRSRAVSSFDYDETPLHRAIAWLLRSFSLGTWFGVPVRMYWAAVVLMPLLFLQWMPGDGPLDVAGHVAIGLVGLFVVIWSHEMGHIAAGWWYQIPTRMITLSPLGGLAHMTGRMPSPRAELVVTLAGPAVHLVWLAVFWPLELLLSPATVWTTWYGFSVWYLAVLNKGLLLFNLLPCFPLDGGRALRALLAMRLHEGKATLWATTVGMIGGGVMIASNVTRAGVYGGIGMLLGLTCVMESLRERRTVRFAYVYERSMRKPWESDADAWKLAVAKQQGGGPGLFARWRADRAERRATAQRERDAELDREVDAILERLHKVGMSGLQAKERELLLRAARRRKGAG